MLASVSVRGENKRRWPLLLPSLVPPVSLIRPDRARPIDRVIDYFGGGYRRTASVAPATRPVRRRHDDETRVTTR
jgi:hypothetical protein